MSVAQKKAKDPWPAERWVYLQDPRGSRWDGVVARVCAGPSLERGASPGEIAVFEPTDGIARVPVEHERRDGTVTKIEEALVYRRVRTRFVRA